MAGVRREPGGSPTHRAVGNRGSGRAPDGATAARSCLLQLGCPRERNRARAGEVARRVNRRVEGRPDAEDAHQRRGVSRPVGHVAGRRAGLGDRVGTAARGTEGPGVALLAVGPRPATVGAVGRGGARLGRRLIAAAGADARAAVEPYAGPGAVAVPWAPRCRFTFEA